MFAFEDAMEYKFLRIYTFSEAVIRHFRGRKTSRFLSRPWGLRGDCWGQPRATCAARAGGGFPVRPCGCGGATEWRFMSWGPNQRCKNLRFSGSEVAPLGDVAAGADHPAAKRRVRFARCGPSRCVEHHRGDGPHANVANACGRSGCAGCVQDGFALASLRCVPRSKRGVCAPTSAGRGGFRRGRYPCNYRPTSSFHSEDEYRGFRLHAGFRQ